MADIKLSELGNGGFVLNGLELLSFSTASFISGIGDVNGDGRDDFVIGTPLGGATDAGQAFVVYGRVGGFPTPIDLANLGGGGFRIVGGSANDWAGYSVAKAGDVNKDGYGDLVVSAFLGDDGGEDAGEAYVIFGSRIANRGVVDLGTIGNNGFKIQGDVKGDSAGSSVAGGGDFNGDGIADVIVGARAGDDGGTGAGEVYVIFGKDVDTRDTVDLTDLATRGEGVVIAGAAAGDNAGQAVAIGDVNGDGLADVLVGAWHADRGADADVGKVYVVFGQKGGGELDVSLDNLTPAQGFVITGDKAGDVAGSSLAAGDVNGDGIADIIIGAPQGDNKGSASGEVYVVYGATNASTRGNISLSALGNNGFAIEGPSIAANVGFSVAYGGDMDGDGIGDLILGAPQADPLVLGGNRGVAYVVFGREGTSRATVQTRALGNEGYAIIGSAKSELAGMGVGVGDVNGDGRPDALLATGTGGGKAYVVYKPNSAPFLAATASYKTLVGTAISFDVGARDGDGDPLTYRVIEPADGMLSAFRGGNITYTPRVGFIGVDQFTIAVDDGRGNVSQQVVTLTVTKTNTAPVIDAQATYTVTAGEALSFTAAGSDADGDVLTYKVIEPADGSLVAGKAGAFTYSKTTAGTDKFTIEVSDGRGGTDTQDVTVTVFAVNTPPVITTTETEYATDAGTELSLIIAASDPDGDPITYAVGQAGEGTIIFNDAGELIYQPADGFVGVDTVSIVVSDGKGGEDEIVLSITVAEPTNAPPVIATERTLTTFAGTSVAFMGGATDPDGDALTYTIQGTLLGAIVEDDDGNFTYEPPVGFTGEDSFTLKVTDSKGASDTQIVTVNIVESPLADDWRLFVEDGFTGTIGGSGLVVGTAEHQKITLADVAGTVSFDASFNRGNDIVELAGEASRWQVLRSGSNAIFTDGDTFVSIPVGSAGTLLLFEDGYRTLRFDSAGGTFAIGDQAFADLFEPVVAPALDDPDLPDPAAVDAEGRLFLTPGALATAGTDDTLNVFGANGDEALTLLNGAIVLDGTFNRGGDTIVLDDLLSNFTATRVGSAVRLESDTLNVLIPFGSAGTDIAFDDGVLSLVFDAAAGAPRLGTQLIDGTGATLIG